MRATLSRYRPEGLYTFGLLGRSGFDRGRFGSGFASGGSGFVGGSAGFHGGSFSVDSGVLSHFGGGVGFSSRGFFGGGGAGGHGQGSSRGSNQSDDTHVFSSFRRFNEVMNPRKRVITGM